MILTSKLADDSLLKPIFLARPELFISENNDESEILKLTILLMFEKMKGSSSFWFPYL
jgi:hypothetical protein